MSIRQLSQTGLNRISCLIGLIFLIYVVLQTSFGTVAWIGLVMSVVLFAGLFLIYHYDRMDRVLQDNLNWLDLNLRRPNRARVSEYPTIEYGRDEDLYSFDTWDDVSESMTARPLEMRIKLVDKYYQAVYLMVDQPGAIKRIMATGKGATIDIAVERLDRSLRERLGHPGTTVQ